MKYFVSRSNYKFLCLDSLICNLRTRVKRAAMLVVAETFVLYDQRPSYKKLDLVQQTAAVS